MFEEVLLNPPFQNKGRVLWQSSSSSSFFFIYFFPAMMWGIWLVSMGWRGLGRIFGISLDLILLYGHLLIECFIIINLVLSFWIGTPFGIGWGAGFFGLIFHMP